MNSLLVIGLALLQLFLSCWLSLHIPGRRASLQLCLCGKDRRPRILYEINALVVVAARYPGRGTASNKEAILISILQPFRPFNETNEPFVQVKLKVAHCQLQAA
jgi:hypothetical protein